MLNTERLRLYTAVLTGPKMSYGFYRLTPAQRHRVRHKGKAHMHFPEQRCERCRPSPKQARKWERE